MPILCSRCSREFNGEYYQDENTNSQNDGRERLCAQCREDCNLD